MASEKEILDIANLLRRDVLEMTTAAKSGHPTSCLSSAEIIASLFFDVMAFDNFNAFNPDNDEFVLSKGHAAPILYAALKRAGCIKGDLDTLRKLDSPFEGHPIPSSMPWVKTATGSLGQGLSNGLGMALASKLQKRKFKVYVLMGDGEMAEGSVYEAMQVAAHYNVGNLIAIVDVNRLGQSGETMAGHNVKAYEERARAFGWNSIAVNGHNVNELKSAFQAAKDSGGKPTMIITKTLKGKGISFLQDKEGWHGKALNAEQLKEALKEIPNSKMPDIKQIKPEKVRISLKKNPKLVQPAYSKGEQVATREAYGNALVKLAESNNLLIALDAEVKNSTFSEKLLQKHPENFLECFIAEQNMVGMAAGLASKGFEVFASTFAAFFTRAHDQIRMAALSSSNLTLVGSHCGVSIGEDGPSQMGLEDIALFRCIPNSIVLYPSDAVSTEKIVELATSHRGVKYIRTSRPKTPIIYDNNEKFELGEFKVLKQSPKDKVVIVALGITLFQALAAQEELQMKGVNVAVVDCYCVKPFNAKKFAAFVNFKPVIVVEDHYLEGGVGEMLSTAMQPFGISISILAVRKVPTSGTQGELLSVESIDSNSIVKKVLSVLK